MFSRSVHAECGPAVMMADTILEEAYSSIFLGIYEYFDRVMTWNNHINSI